MHITQLDLTPIAVPRETGFLSRHVLVRLEADDGTVGWGEMSDFGHLPAYLPDLDDLQTTLRGLLVGRDPRPLNHWVAELREWYPEAQYYYDMGSVIRAGVDIALHDLVARSLGVSVAALFGGPCRDAVPICYPIFRLTDVDQVDENLDRVAQRVGEGFDRFRLYVGRDLAADLAFLEAFEGRFGDAARIKSFDYSHLLDAKDCLRWTARLREICEPELVESPAHQGDFDALRYFRERCDLPVSEHGYATRQVVAMLTGGCLDVLNICVTFIGGIGPARELFALARASGVGTLLGTTQELSIGTAAQAQVACAVSNLTHPGDPVGPALYQADVVEPRVCYAGGTLRLPQGAGLGIQPDPERVEALRAPLAWGEVRPIDSLDRTVTESESEGS